MVFIESLARPPGRVASCIQDGTLRLATDSNSDLFRTCLQTRANLFLSRDYAEAKDLSKSFLTLLTAILVASITFSEKIVDLGHSSWWARGSMVGCWILLLIAIAACGSGLTLMTFAAGMASYQPDLDYFSYETQAMKLYIVAGLAFGTGLASLLLAGLISLVERHVSLPPGAEHPPTGSSWVPR